VASWVPLDHAQCAGRYWRAPVDFGFARALGTVPVALDEIAPCAACLPLVLDRNAMPWAVLRLGAGDTALITADGRWRGSYVPALLQVYPFAPAPAGGVLVDAEIITTDPSNTVPFYDPTGAVAAETAWRLCDVSKLAAAEGRTRDAALAILHADLLGPPPDPRLSPYHGVNAQALATVGRVTLGKLHRSGALALIHAVILSHAHLPVLDTAEQAACAQPTALRTFLTAIAQDQSAARWQL
jgi:hypothetical protein